VKFKEDSKIQGSPTIISSEDPNKIKEKAGGHKHVTNNPLILVKQFDPDFPPQTRTEQ
jgi:hypothetical protein